MQSQIEKLKAQIAGTLGELQVYIEDEAGAQTMVSNHTVVKLFAGYYVDEITNQSDRKGAIVTKNYKLKLSNTKATELELMARLVGDRIKPAYASGVSAVLGVAPGLTADTNYANDTYYTGEGRYDLVPVQYQNIDQTTRSTYSYFKDAADEKVEKALLNEMTKDAYKNRRLWFGTETNPYDPRYQTEDLGDKAMKASEYGIKNLKIILPNLIEWSKEKGEDYSELEDMYNSLVGQFRRYMGHVTKNVGGIYDSPKTYDMTGDQFQVVPKSIQKDAVAFLNKQLFNTPKWLLDQKVLALDPKIRVYTHLNRSAQ